MKKHITKIELSKETLRALAAREVQTAAAAVGSGRYTFCNGCSDNCG